MMGLWYINCKIYLSFIVFVIFFIHVSRKSIQNFLQQVIRKNPKHGFSFYYDDKFIRINTKHFCLFDCQACQRRCRFQSLIKLFMSAEEHPQETIIKLKPVIEIGFPDTAGFGNKIVCEMFNHIYLLTKLLVK